MIHLLERMRMAESSEELWAIETTFDALRQISEYVTALRAALAEVSTMDPQHTETDGIIQRAGRNLAEIGRRYE